MDIRERIKDYITSQDAVYRALALDLHAHPEVCNEEYHACEILSAQLTREGFTVKTDIAGHPTGFTAVYKSEKAGPVLVFLAEYDALPGLGHGCGHNLFGPTSCLAAAALKQVIDEVGGEVRVYGTPGEEGGINGSAKGSFVREGYLEGVDAALCVHPGDVDEVTSHLIACAPCDIEFWGKPSHAAAAPEKGINALDALILTYNGINALRQHLPSDVRIHGVITSGGDAANIVPEYASARFFFRAATSPVLDMVYRKMENIVAGAALMTGAKGSLKPVQNRVENMILTPLLDKVYAEEMAGLGVKVGTPDPTRSVGSSDVGNISQVVPTIQPTIRITTVPTPWHTEASRDASCSELGLQSIALGAKALAFTALRLIQDPALLRAIQDEHREALRAQAAQG
ncbi:MAG: M20 family metallopeptidase [Clostridia bacterium]|nr:M20 family metallopeptidase [Clostridia bacterium]